MAYSSASPQTTAEHDPASQRRWHAAALGLTISGDFPVMGLSGGAAAPRADAQQVELRLTQTAQLERGWPAGDPQRIGEQRDSGGRAVLTIDVHPRGGYLMRGSGYGRALIAPDATHVQLAPGRASRWRWQRYLIGQVLPFVSGLHGIELLHAGAVQIAGVVVGVVGGSGLGKSSLVAALVNRGAAFMADDVLALTREQGEVIGHPGPGVLVAGEAGLALQERAPGPTLARAPGEVAVALAPAPPAPLGALCFLESGATQLTVERLSAGEPQRLLGSAYEVVRRGPERLRAQLELMSQLADGVQLLRVARPVTIRPDALAEALLAELEVAR